MSQFDEISAVWLSGFTALAQVCGIGISIYLVDRMGRRPLVLVSLASVTVSLWGLGLSFYLARVTSEPVQKALGDCESQPTTVWSGITSYCYDCASMDNCGFCGGMCIAGNFNSPFDLNLCPGQSKWIYRNCSNHFAWASVFFMVAYLLAFGIGMGGTWNSAHVCVRKTILERRMPKVVVVAYWSPSHILPPMLLCLLRHALDDQLRDLSIALSIVSRQLLDFYKLDRKSSSCCYILVDQSPQCSHSLRCILVILDGCVRRTSVAVLLPPRNERFIAGRGRTAVSSQ